MEAQTERLYDAALLGDVPSLLKLLRDDPLILNRCIIEKSSRFVQSPLHVATTHGHLEFIKEVVRQKPELAAELDQSKRWSPLHMASANGHLEILNSLLAVNSSMCFVRDLDGRNALHVAAVNGQIQALGVLLRAKPQAARERTTDGETILHLCVKHSQSQALMFLVRTMGDGQLLNSKDSEGNTVLHLAVAAKHYETIDFLLNDKRMAKNTINTNGLTAMDTCIQATKDGHDGGIWLTLRRAKVSRAKALLKPRTNTRDWMEKQRTALMVVSSLIATMAFQAGINPPGGVWQDDNNGHIAGTSIMAKQDPVTYEAFLVSNTIGLVSSLTVIILLISGLPCMKLVVRILMVTMWIAMTASTFTYTFSVYFVVSSKKSLEDLINPTTSKKLVQTTIIFASNVWVLFLGFLIVSHVLRFFIRLFMQIIRLVIQGIRNSYANARRYPPV